jgi:predicted transposase/invertase (TIGR01784 family)
MEMDKERTVQRYVDILTNGGFKALFGDINNKEAVMAIINALLPEHRQVADIEYLPTERQGQMEDNKEYRYDFMCRDSSGAMFIVELQRYREKSWFKRCVSYAARAYDRQNRRGENYDVPPVYLIGLMGTEINHSDREFWRDRYVSEYTFREKEAHDLLDETIVIIFAELVRFDKAESECTTDVDRMLFILKNMGRLDRQPELLRREIYTKIFEACEIARFNEDKLIQFNKDMYDERRRNGELAAAIEEGMEKGMEKGRIDAMRRMLAAGISAEQVCAIMEVTPEEIAAMKKMTGM